MKSLLAIMLFGIMVLMLMYGMIAEVELRELRYSDGWYKWQHERVIAERRADKEWTR